MTKFFKLTRRLFLRMSAEVRQHGLYGINNYITFSLIALSVGVLSNLLGKLGTVIGVPVLIAILYSHTDGKRVKERMIRENNYRLKFGKITKEQHRSFHNHIVNDLDFSSYSRTSGIIILPVVTLTSIQIAVSHFPNDTAILITFISAIALVYTVNYSDASVKNASFSENFSVTFLFGPAFLIIFSSLLTYILLFLINATGIISEQTIQGFHFIGM